MEPSPLPPVSCAESARERDTVRDVLSRCPEGATLSDLQRVLPDTPASRLSRILDDLCAAGVAYQQVEYVRPRDGRSRLRPSETAPRPTTPNSGPSSASTPLAPTENFCRHVQIARANYLRLLDGATTDARKNLLRTAYALLYRALKVRHHEIPPRQLRLYDLRFLSPPTSAAPSTTTEKTRGFRPSRNSRSAPSDLARKTRSNLTRKTTPSALTTPPPPVKRNGTPPPPPRLVAQSANTAAETRLPMFLRTLKTVRLHYLRLFHTAQHQQRLRWPHVYATIFQTALTYFGISDGQLSTLDEALLSPPLPPQARTLPSSAIAASGAGEETPPRPCPQNQEGEKMARAYFKSCPPLHTQQDASPRLPTHETEEEMVQAYVDSCQQLQTHLRLPRTDSRPRRTKKQTAERIRQIFN